MAISTSLPNFLQPTQGKGLYAGNYLNFLADDHNQWAQQFLPDVYDKEVEIYGNRTISGFLKMVSAEMPSTSDQIIWLEQGRLHARYTGLAATYAAATGVATFTVPAASTGAGLPTNSQTGTDEGSSNRNINFRIGQTVMVQREATAGGKGVGDTIKGVVTAVAASGLNFSMLVYQNATAITGTVPTGGAATFTALAYGSEFAKGTGNFTEKLDPSYSTYSNAPIIMKEHYAINGSDTGQIGWIEVTSENGASGYLWYVKAEHENRLRWEDYIEMSMVEGVTNATTATGTAPELQDYRGDGAGATTTDLAARGTEGFFAALQSRGNVYNDLSGDLTSTTAATPGLDAFDTILRQLDKQGSIEENMLYVDRDLSLAFTDMLAAVNSTGNALGTSYGIFNNSEDMACLLYTSPSPRDS